MFINQPLIKGDSGMKFCDKCVGEEGACCDFCRYYDFNGKGRVYTGNGFCRKHDRKQDPEDVCDDFYCKEIAV